jgi:hypothetical protein
MPIERSIVEEFMIAATAVIQELLTYAQLPAAERDEADEGQVRRIKGIVGALESAVSVASERPYTPPPAMPAPQFPIPLTTRRVP